MREILLAPAWCVFQVVNYLLVIFISILHTGSIYLRIYYRVILQSVFALLKTSMTVRR